MGGERISHYAKEIRKKVQLSSKIGEIPSRAELKKYLNESRIKEELSSEDEEILLLGIWVKKWLTKAN